MRRKIACGVIGAYLLTLGFGLFSHVLGYKSNTHVAMYFVVWDMYCGWCGYEVRHHIIAQGKSGEYYDLSPPWGEFVPFGSAKRCYYDSNCLFTPQLALNVLDHTDHEEISLILRIEESWSKKYSLSDKHYLAQYEEPKVKRSYFRRRQLVSGQGTVTENYLNWTNWLANQALLDNPRLQQDMKAKPFLMPNSNW